MNATPRAFVLAVLVALVLPLAVAGTAGAQISIDDFTDAQSGTGTLDTANVVGGERDIREVSGAAATIAAGTATCAGNFLTACVFVYDGNDSDAATDAQPGFAPIDFTAGGQDRFELPATLDSGSCSLTFTVCDSTPTCMSQQALVATGTMTFLYSGFTGVAFGAVTFVSINVAPQTSPSSCSLGEPTTTPVELLAFGVE